MSLTSASIYNSITWSQEKINTGFSPTYQGPETWSFPINFVINDLTVDSIYTVEGTLAALGSTTIDFKTLTDSFGDALDFTRLYSVQISVTGATLQVGPGASNPCLWFFLGATDRIVVRADSCFSYASNYPADVTSGAKTWDLYNSSATTALTYKIAIIGGQGAGTTSTTTTTATTVSSSTTPLASTSSSSTSQAVTSSTSTTP